MRYSYASFGMIAIGLIAFSIVMVFQRVTINNEADYYTLKEAMEASMLESVDIACYRLSEADGGCGGKIKISKEKFIGNFTRRFAKNITGNSDAYTISFYDIMESPPKASILISNSTDSFSNEWDNFDIKNALTAVIDADAGAESKTNINSCSDGEIVTASKEVTYYANPVLKSNTVNDYILNTSKSGIVFNEIDNNVYNNLISLYINNISIVKDYITDGDANNINWDKSLAYSYFKGKNAKTWNNFAGDSAKYKMLNPQGATVCDGNISSRIIILHDGSEYYYRKNYNESSASVSPVKVDDVSQNDDTKINAPITDDQYVIRIFNTRNAKQIDGCENFVLTYTINWEYKYCKHN